MTVGLEKQYPEEARILAELFGLEGVGARYPRLDEIHEQTESRWREYVDKLPARQVEYLLIAEAPPWSPAGRPQYVLDPASTPRTLLKALRVAFRLPVVKGTDSSAALARLAEQRFLVVDSIPFAMDYSSKRGTPRYDELVARTVRTYLQEKLQASALDWSPDLRIAFSLQANAIAILKSLPELALGGRRYPLSKEMIAVNGAHYPDGVKLRKLFYLDPEVGA